MRGFGIGRHGRWPSWQVEGVGKVAVSLARPRPRPAWRRPRPAPAVARRRPRGLGAHRSCRTAPGSPSCRPVARPRRRRRRSSPTIAKAERGSRSARGPRSDPATAWRKTSGDGLPRIVRPTPGREFEPDDEARRRRASRPCGVSHHGLRCIARNVGAAADQPEGDVHVPVRQVVARVADDDRGDGARRGGVGLVGGQHRLAGELAPRVVGGEHEQRPARVIGRGVGGRGRRRR